MIQDRLAADRIELEALQAQLTEYRTVWWRRWFEAWLPAGKTLRDQQARLQCGIGILRSASLFQNLHRIFNMPLKTMPNADLRPSQMSHRNADNTVNKDELERCQSVNYQRGQVRKAIAEGLADLSILQMERVHTAVKLELQKNIVADRP